MKRRRILVSLLGSLLISGLASCLPEGVDPMGSPRPAADSFADLPGGFGTLREDDVSLRVVVDGVQVRLTPLDPRVIRLTAPDTWRRLEALRDEVAPTMPVGASLFLVSIQTEAPGGAEFDAEDVAVLHRGRRLLPERIQGRTPGWGTGRLQPRRTEQAVHAFAADVDPLLDLALEVRGQIDGSWATSVLPRLDAERARVRARTGGTQASRPNFLILR